MESYLSFDHYDLITPDGSISSIINRTETTLEVTVEIHDISPAFVGYKIGQENVFFNVKSTLAQLGINGLNTEIVLEPKARLAQVRVSLTSFGSIGKKMLSLLTVGCYIGRLFGADPSRRVRDPSYISRMFGRTDRDGHPLLSLGGSQNRKSMRLEKIDGFTVAFLPLLPGVLHYDADTLNFLPTLAKALKYRQLRTRHLLNLHQVWKEGEKKTVSDNEMLLVKTVPLHVRTVFARVISPLLPTGFEHTSASVLQPDTKASGDVYEFYGKSDKEIEEVPLEFYTLEPQREYIFFSDRDQLKSSLDDPATIFKAFDTAPEDPAIRSSIFVVKGTQLLSLTADDWIQRKAFNATLPGLFHPQLQTQLIQEYIQQQPDFPFLKAIENGWITSQGVLFNRYFPSPFMKKMLLGDLVQSSLKRIYFLTPSQSAGQYFSHEDRALLLDLAKFAIPVYWADKISGKILEFVPKPEKDTGMFVPLNLVEPFLKSTVFGVYGSNLIGQFEDELTKLLEGVLQLRDKVSHPLLFKDKPLSLVTGGGTGVMEVGNKVAKKLGIISCANIVDFSAAHLPEAENPYIDAKMNFRLDRLVERQDEFHLDFPIILQGGIGTDFEFALEQLRRKVESDNELTPVLLFGTPEYWEAKITSRYKLNVQTGTIAGSEWVSNCFHCIQTASQGLKIYEQFFSGVLPIGREFPPAPEGFF